jgi:hypothetical protein
VVTETACHVLLVLVVVRLSFGCQIMWQVDARRPGFGRSLTPPPTEAGIFAVDGIIQQVGPTVELPQTADLSSI